MRDQSNGRRGEEKERKNGKKMIFGSIICFTWLRVLFINHIIVSGGGERSDSLSKRARHARNA